MTNFSIDNSANNLKKVVLWQYDNAYRLLTLLHVMKSYYDISVKQFWDKWIDDVLNIDLCNDFGASVWGRLLGVERPSLLMSDTPTPASLPMYRRILKATAHMYRSGCSLEDIAEYLMMIFSCENDEGKTVCGVELVDNQDMSIEYTKGENYERMTDEQKLVYEQYGDTLLHYPLGIRYNVPLGGLYFGVAGQSSSTPQPYASNTAYAVGDSVLVEDGDRGTCVYTAAEAITAAENTGWDAIADKMAFVQRSKAQLHGSFTETEAPAYEVRRAYAVGDTVTADDGKIYVLTDRNLSPARNLSWDTVKGHFSEVREDVMFATEAMPFLSNAPYYETGTAYAVGDPIKLEGKYNICTTAVAAEENTSWQSVKSSFEEIEVT